MTVLGPAPQGSVVLPEQAVVEADGKSVVFVVAPGGYVRREVVKGGSVDGKTLLLSGLKAREQVVTTGTSALKALTISK